MKKLLEDLKLQLTILKEKIEIVQSNIDVSDSEIVKIKKSEFQLLEFKFDRGYTFIYFKECLFIMNSEMVELFKDGKLKSMVIRKLEKPSSWSYGKFIVTHKLLNEIEAAKHIHYSY